MRKRYTLFVKIIATVIPGIICLAVALSILNIQASEDVYVDNFVESQEKLFRQIDLDIYDFFADVGGITSGVNSSTAVCEYLTRDEWDVVEQRANILTMKKNLAQTPIEEHSEMNLILLGLNGRTLNYSSTNMALTGNELLETDIVNQALDNPGQLVCEYLESGYTEVMEHAPVIAMAKAIRENNRGQVVGVTLINIKESDFCLLYSHFTAGDSEIIIFNQDDRIISSNKKSYLAFKERELEVAAVLHEMKTDGIRGKLVKKENDSRGYMMQRLQSTNYTILGIVDASAAFSNAYDFRYIIGITGMITAIIAIAVFVIVRQLTYPLWRLAQHMERVEGGDLHPFTEVSGTIEIWELSRTYNTMLAELDEYIRRLMQVEREKREAEINSLQMQINPHYIYNTLASVKWLIWQGETDKSVRLIDAFIKLLRNTISNKQDMITLRQEIENLKDYVLINQIRYGDQVKVAYYVLPQCEDFLVPKLILQPFVENAFFHAFPDGRGGSIEIFVRKKGRFLLIEIADTGVGIDDARLCDIKQKRNIKSEHFTGIGINNVDNRIKLIYGQDYGIDIQSEAGRGTVVSLRFPNSEDSYSS